MTFANAINTIPDTKTANGAGAFSTTSSKALDFFYQAPANRGNIVVNTELFTKALAENTDLAVRTLLYLRDIREGAGERETFRNLLVTLAQQDSVLAGRVCLRVPTLGRWDDLLLFVKAPGQTFYNEDLETLVVGMIVEELERANKARQHSLCAKWLPRQGRIAARLRELTGVSPKEWRKLLVRLSNTVEQQMCANDWTSINFSHVPSQAANRYRKAFNRHEETRYQAWVEAVKNGTSPEVKVNASAIYPYQVTGDLISTRGQMDQNQINQWNALPDFMNGKNILPMIDISGSMYARTKGNGPAPYTIAVSLGVYCAERQKGGFQNCFLTFTDVPKLYNLPNTSVDEKLKAVCRSEAGYNTNFYKAIQVILKLGIRNKLPQEEMPEILLVLSDMQFDQSPGDRYTWNETNYQTLVDQYNKAGYTVPKIVFWNLNGVYGTAPVKQDQPGVALISGFSPAAVKDILGGEISSPYQIMVKRLSTDRYNY